MARLQYSVTQPMSCVTSTMPLAACTSSMHAGLGLDPEFGVARGEDLVEQQDVRIDGRGDGESPSRARMPEEYVLIGASMNWPMSA